MIILILNITAFKFLTDEVDKSNDGDVVFDKTILENKKYCNEMLTDKILVDINDLTPVSTKSNINYNMQSKFNCWKLNKIKYIFVPI